MKTLHICWGTGPNNGAANAARLVMDEERAAGHEPLLVRRPTWSQLRTADLVWCHCGWYWVFWLVAAFRRGRFRWMPAGCYDPVRLAYHGWKKRLVGPLERWALRRADALVATCPAEAAWIRDYLGAGKRRGSDVPKIEVCDVKRFFDLDKKDRVLRPRAHVSASSPLRVLFLGRRHPLKGLKYLERAVERANGRGGVELRVVGDHRGEELERDWAWCDVLCLPTLSDNFGLVVAEALERGKRVITTDGAPAWAEPGPWSDRLVYLRGYREGTAETRVRLLEEALASACASAAAGEGKP